MATTVTDLSKKRQARKAGKPDLKKAMAEIEARQEPEPVAPAPTDLEARELALDSIIHGRNPRIVADSDQMKELVASMKAIGLIQPIRVRPVPGGVYEIIAGNRRYEAARRLGWETIRVDIGTPQDREAFLESLTENIQREELSAIDQARAFQALLADGMTQKSLATSIGKSQPYISNTTRLLKLPTAIQDQIASGLIKPSSAEALTAMPVEQATKIARRIVSQHLTTNDVEVEVAAFKKQQEQADRQAKAERDKVDEYAAMIDSAKGNYPDDTTFITWDRAVVLPLQKRGYNVQEEDHRETVRQPQWECDCHAILIYASMTGGRESEQKIITTKVCLRREEHGAAHRAALEETRSEERRKAEAEQIANAQLTAEVRAKIAAALGSKETVNALGARVTLYALLRTPNNGYHEAPSQRLLQFLERHKGELDPTAEDPSSLRGLWKTLAGLSNAEAVAETTRLLAAEVMPNVWSLDVNRLVRDAEIREALVEKLGLEETAVWGGSEPPSRTNVEGNDFVRESDEGWDTFGNLWAEPVDPTEKHDFQGAPGDDCQTDDCGELEDALVHQHDKLCKGQHDIGELSCTPYLVNPEPLWDGGKPEAIAEAEAEEIEEAEEVAVP